MPGLVPGIHGLQGGGGRVLANRPDVGIARGFRISYLDRPSTVADKIRADLCVIGAGAAGLSVTAGATRLGASVILIEQARMGGECLYTGCIPSKSLLIAAARGDGLAAAYDHVRRVIQTIEPQDSAERYRALGAYVLRGKARFVAPRFLEAGETSVTARRFVIATGSEPVVPAIPGLDSVPYLTNETLFDTAPEPDHLIVLGGGPVGVEMAQAYRRLGARVTVVEATRLLGRDDPELARVVRARLIEEGVEIIEAAAVSAVEAAGDGIALTCGAGAARRRLGGSHLLVAAGRRPNVADLGLETAGIDLRDGALVVDAGLRTTNRRIYAIGDVVGPHRFTHMANYQARMVLKNALFRLPARVRYDAVPWVTYTDPELAHVGLDEAAARAACRGLRVLRFPFSENDRAIAENATEGLVKVVTTPRGRVLGASIVGAHAGELILPWALAVRQRLKIGTLAQAIVPYPTLSEASARAAGSFYSPTLFGDRTRLLVRLLARLG